MISILPVAGLPEIREGDDIGALIAEAAELEDGDVIVVAQKAVSKAEGRIVRLDDVEASEQAIELAEPGIDPRKLEVILRETKRIVRSRGPLVIAETQHGFVCASAGVDESNAPEAGVLVLLPADSDASAREIRASIHRRTGTTVGVIVSDSFGRPFREGTTDVAIGVAGLAPLIDLRGTVDRAGYVLRTSQVARADELAGAADLVRGKADGVPAVIVRGAAASGDGTAAELVITSERDLFR
ncbi:MAG TPA: coenzyme F420-0:L-glutamate ligase [Gaiellaceae bacterium]|nr:coenzyme F420-0:L-glutamate ligase [Gaiellaceae bacterium]